MIRALPVTVGNALASATIFTGTGMPSIVAGTTVPPTPVLLASVNASVAIAGTTAGASCAGGERDLPADRPARA